MPRPPRGRGRPGARVLMLHHGAELYGSDRVFLRAAECLAGQSRVLVVLDNPGLLEGELGALGIEVRVRRLGVMRKGRVRASRLPALVTEQIGAVAWLLRLIRRERVDLVYSNTAVVVTGAIAAALARVPHVWHVHELFTQPAWMARLVGATVLALSARVVAVSHAVSRWLSGCRPSAAERIVVIHNPLVHEAETPMTTTELKEAFGIPEGTTVVCLTGRINSRKGHLALVEAMRILRRRGRHHVVCLMVGNAFPGSEHFVDELRTRIAEAGLDDRIKLLGFREDAYSIMGGCDVVLVPSTAPEPFGLVAAEAQSLGRPVIASATGGLVEIVEDGVTGLLVPPGDSEALAVALEKLADDEALRIRLGREAHERALERFSMERFCSALSGAVAEAHPGGRS